MGLVGLPDPLSDDLAEAGAEVIQDDSERDSQQAGGVIHDLVGYGRGAGEGARGREAQAAVTAGVSSGGISSGGSSPAVSHPAPPATESPATCQPPACPIGPPYITARSPPRNPPPTASLSNRRNLVGSLRRFASHLLFLLASQLTPFVASSGSTASH